MRSSLNKDIYRDIKNSFSRFISIVAIVAIGVALFSGVKVSSPVMKITADNYYDEQNFMDLQVVSTFGLTDGDVDSIKNIKGVEGVFPTYSLDVITTFNATESVLKVHGLDLNHMNDDDKSYINRPVLVKGRFPEKSGECVVEAGIVDTYDIEIGDTIEVQSGKDEDISESLKTNKFTVVGTVNSPSYVSFQKGSSSIGSGSINGFILIPNYDFNLPAYTEVFLTLKGAKELQTYDEEYDEVVDKVSDTLKAVGIERSKIRQLEIKAEAEEKIIESKEELQQGKEKAKLELSNAENTLKDAENKIALGESELMSKESVYKATIASAEDKINTAEQALRSGEEQYKKEYDEFLKVKKDAQIKIDEAEKQIASGEAIILKLEDYINTLRNEISNGEINGQLTEDQKKELEQKISEMEGILSEVKGTLASSKAELEKQKQALIDGENQLATAKAEIEAGKVELEKQKSNLATEKAKAEKQFESARNEINKGKSELIIGKSDYEKAKKDTEAELLEAEEKITDAEEDLKNLDMPKWYILDRNTNYSYVDYENSANSIDAIAQVFPVFFFIVAALVCLTTMTRMVDEQRGNIGTLKALGYSKLSIMSKYIIYAVTASLSGSIIGIIIGFTVLPIVVFNAYRLMYQLPSVILSFNVTYALISTLAAVMVTTMAALVACYKELVETPSLLMRPKAPAVGKRIWLERIPFIWNRLRFLAKVCARNIFRYKKRFFMTVIGVAGCTALLLTGYGITDSIQAIVHRQFGEIYKYDMTIGLEDNLSVKKYDEVKAILDGEDNIEDYMRTDTLNIKVSNKDIEKDVTLVVPEDTNELKDFIVLRNRSNKDKIELSDNGVVLNEKLAKQLGVKVGDIINISKDNEGATDFEVKVEGVTEHYLYHYIYMSPKLYEEVYKEQPQYNQIIAKVVDADKESEDVLATDIIKNDNIISVSFNTSLKENFDDMIGSLNLVVIVIIIFAGALAFVVLYNLTNVNISERIREIATIKVLGFYNKEVSAYVYRENTILTFIGMLLGLGLGVMLHRYIMVTVELDTIMFGRNINFISYVWAGLLTMVFGAIVNFVMYFKLKKVPMVESLKSVD